MPKMQPEDIRKQVPLNEGCTITKEDLSNEVVHAANRLIVSLRKLAREEENMNSVIANVRACSRS